MARHLCRLRSDPFDFDTEDVFAGLPIAGDVISAPAAKQLTKITPFVFMHFLLL
jgi:hypothetical protein